MLLPFLGTHAEYMFGFGGSLFRRYVGAPCLTRAGRKAQADRMACADGGGSEVSDQGVSFSLIRVFIVLVRRLVCLTCFSWKLVGVMTTATAVAILEVALAVSAGLRRAHSYPPREFCCCRGIIFCAKEMASK